MDELLSPVGVFAALIVVLKIALPIAVLYVVARTRGRSPLFALWGLLSWFGVIIGMVIMITTRKEPEL